MPVLVTGATGCVGRALIPKLVEYGGQVRVYVRRDVPEYRGLGVHVAIGEADHEGRLESALEQVHTLVHLTGGIDLDPGISLDWLNLTSTEVAIRAAENAEVRRILFLSHVGADPSSDHPYLAAKGAAEAAVRGSRLEHAVFRCTPIWGPGSVLSRFIEKGATTQARMNPLAVGDVVAALVAADTRDAELRDVWELGGPEQMSLQELAERAGAKRRALPPRGLPKVGALYLRDRIADPSEAVRQFGLTLTPVV
ncbi:MAG: SDR family oxidoreductase [Gemmatimonadota bacterium]